MQTAPLAFEVPNTELEIAAYVSGGNDLVIVITGPSGCLGHLVIEELCAADLRHVRFGEHRIQAEECL